MLRRATKATSAALDGVSRKISGIDATLNTLASTVPVQYDVQSVPHRPERRANDFLFRMQRHQALSPEAIDTLCLAL